jgi:hypothetical protein
MSPASTAAAARLRGIPGAAPDIPPLAASLGLSASDVPRWALQLLIPEVQQWATERWDPSSAAFEFRTTDHLTLTRTVKDLTVSLRGLSPLAALEILTSVAVDAAENIRNAPWAVRTITQAATAGDAWSLFDLKDTSVSQESGRALRRWCRRLEIAAADPNAEWDRDEIRLAVVKPEGRAYRLCAGQISQPWLRDLLVGLLRVRVHSLSERSMNGWAPGGGAVVPLLGHPERSRAPAICAGRVHHGRVDGDVACRREPRRELVHLDLGGYVRRPVPGPGSRPL